MKTRGFRFFQSRQNAGQLLGLSVIIVIILWLGLSNHFHESAVKKATARDSLHSACLKNDSLIQENKILKEQLAAKLQSYCDTISPAEKIARGKLSKFFEQARAERDRQEHVLFKEKASRQEWLYKKQEYQELDSFYFYHSRNLSAARNLMKNNPNDFVKYAVARFMSECMFDTDYDSEVCILERKVEPINLFHLVDSTTEAAIESSRQSIGRIYEARHARLDSAYQVKLKALEKQLAIKVAKKAKELGLSK